MTPQPLTSITYVRMSRAWESQSPFGCPNRLSAAPAAPYGCKRHLRKSRARRSRLAAQWALLIFSMVIALVPAALAVWAWGQIWGTW